MLKQLKVRNFQSHKESTFDFAPGMNVITGHSCAGKSAIFRNIQWLRLNRPNAMTHVSRWARTFSKSGKMVLTDQVCACELVSDHGKVSRHRNKDVNGYTIGTKLLEAVGTDVPKEIGDVLKIGDVNVQGQHDHHFFLSWSPPEIARYLNGILGMQAMDTAQSLAAKKVRDVNDTISLAKVTLANEAKELEELQWIDKANALLADAETLQEAHTAKKQAIQALFNLVSRAKMHKADLAKHSWVPNASLLLDSIKQINIRIERAWVQWNALNRLVQNAKAHKALVASSQVPADALLLVEQAKQSNADLQAVSTKGRALHGLLLQAKAKKLEADKGAVDLKAFDLLDELKQIAKRHANATADVLKISALLANAKNQRATFLSSNTELGLLELDMKDAIARLPPTCSTCGQTIKGNHGNH